MMYFSERPRTPRPPGREPEPNPPAPPSEPTPWPEYDPEDRPPPIEDDEPETKHLPGPPQTKSIR